MKRGAQALGWLWLLLVVAACPALASTPAEDNPLFEAHVVGVIDGDTVDVLVTPETAHALGFRKRKTPLMIRVRVTGIDAPERGQAWSQRSKQALSGLVFNKDIIVHGIEGDRYGRLAGILLRPAPSVTCTIDGAWRDMRARRPGPCAPTADLNESMVQGGHAWAYGQYAYDKRFCDLEVEARNAHRGLWSQPPATWIAPWDFRRRIREAGEPRGLQACRAQARKAGR